jgi:hypothetical protein
VSEAGFMMEEETLQLIIGHLRELKADINGVKMDISAVNAGQEELSTEMNAVYAGQEDLKAEMNAVYAGQEIEPTRTLQYVCMLHTCTYVCVLACVCVYMERSEG